MPKRHYIIYSDESDKKGKLYSNFYGGVLLRSRDQQAISELLEAKKFELNLGKELKWTKVTSQYLEKYIEFIRFYFTFIASGRLKFRLMFTKNMIRPVGLTKEQYEEQYFKLYYQFIKHGFGIKYCNPNCLDRVYFTILPDQLPDSIEKIEEFKKHLSNIPLNQDMIGNNIFIPKNQISDVDSSQHNILQGLDIILGSMNAKLNGTLSMKVEGTRMRGKRTIAKDKLHKEICKQIRLIHPNFNIGLSTSSYDGLFLRWEQPYRHWLFIPNDHRIEQN